MSDVDENNEFCLAEDRFEDMQHNVSDRENFEFDCLTRDQVHEILNEPVEILSSVLMLPPSFSKLLLSTSKWALDSVIENYLKDSSQFLILSKLKAENTVNSTELPTTLICPICSTMFPKEVFSGMDCNHLFCRDCWCTYFQNKVLNETSCTRIECMSCSVIATEDFVLSFLISPDLKDRYKRLTFTEYVRSHPELRFCAGPNCDMIIHAEEKKTARVICHSCNTIFCFCCSGDYHAPADCETIQKWLTEIVKRRTNKDGRGDKIGNFIYTPQDDDGKTVNYIAKWTKECPKCTISIEKNGGCHIMRCTNCKILFCWICLDVGAKCHGCQCFKIANDSSEAKFLRYYERWEYHAHLLRPEAQARFRDRIHDSFDFVMNTKGTKTEYRQCLLDAADLIDRCRYTLQYTYPYAYFLEPGPKKELFEYQQHMLEVNIQILSSKVTPGRCWHEASNDLSILMDICRKHRLVLLQNPIY